MPDLPSTHAGAVIVLTALALVAFTRDRIPLETTSLTILAALTVGFTLFPYHDVEVEHLFSGFGHEALVAVCALMMAGQGLVRTGALQPVGAVLARLWGPYPTASLLLTLVVGGLLSAFVNNTPIVVLLLPILTAASLSVGAPPSRVLMPVGFATLVGGMGTTIGTSTNLLVVAVAADLGLTRFGMFDFFLPAAIAASVAIVFLWLVAPRMLPVREPPMADVSQREFAASLRMREDAEPIALAELIRKTDGKLRIRRLRRGDTALVPFPDLNLRPGDELGIKANTTDLKAFEAATGLQLFAGDERVGEETVLDDGGELTAEIVLQPGSPAVGRTVNGFRRTDLAGVSVLGLYRVNEELRGETRYYNQLLRDGDVLLVQGKGDEIAKLKQASLGLLVLDATSELPRTSKAPLALVIMAAIVSSAALGLVPIAIAAVAGTLAMIVSGCMTWRAATQALNAQIVLIVASSLALGYALQETGAALWLTQVFLHFTEGSSPAVIIAGLMAVMAVLTNVVSNNAAAVIGTPIAFNIATELDKAPEPFVLAVLFGANMSYATPMAYKTNLLVMTAGGYAFSDFVRIGVPLTLLVWGTLSFVLPWLYGL